MKITFVIDSLKSGGAQRVMSLMANYWAEQGNNVTIIIFVEFDPFYELDENITIIKIPLIRHSRGIWDAFCSNVKRICSVKNALKENNPDIIISFMTTTNVVAICAAKLLRIPVIVSERNDPRYMPLNIFWKIMRSVTYYFADAIVTQSKYTIKYLQKISLNKKVYCIYNTFIPLKKIGKKFFSKQNVILSVGRVDPQKRHDILIKIFADLKLKDWQLWIAGEKNVVGQESWMAKLKKIIAEENLHNRVKFLGISHNIISIYAQSSIFVLSSEREGFPNVLVEAMSLGLPCIAFDCPTGPSEIIQHSVDGLLVPFSDVQEMTRHIKRLILNPSERERLGEHAQKSIRRFKIEDIMTEWERLIEHCKK